MKCGRKHRREGERKKGALEGAPEEARHGVDAALNDPNYR